LKVCSTYLKVIHRKKGLCRSKNVAMCSAVVNNGLLEHKYWKNVTAWLCSTNHKQGATSDCRRRRH